MALADPSTTTGYRAWVPIALPPAAPPATFTGEEIYVGKHRKPGIRSFAMFRMFYKPRHRG